MTPETINIDEEGVDNYTRVHDPDDVILEQEMKEVKEKVRRGFLILTQLKNDLERVGKSYLFSDALKKFYGKRDGD